MVLVSIRKGGFWVYAWHHHARPTIEAIHKDKRSTSIWCDTDANIGDLRGVLEITMPMRVPVKTTRDTFDYMLIYFIIGGIIMLTTVIWVLGRD